jgi:hypothetical protein
MGIVLCGKESILVEGIHELERDTDERREEDAPMIPFQSSTCNEDHSFDSENRQRQI